MSEREIIRNVNKLLSSLIPREEPYGDSVVKGVCRWLADMGILDGDAVEVFDRIKAFADEGGHALRTSQPSTYECECGATMPESKWMEHECYWTRAEARHAQMMEDDH